MAMRGVTPAARRSRELTERCPAANHRRRGPPRLVHAASGGAMAHRSPPPLALVALACLGACRGGRTEAPAVPSWSAAPPMRHARAAHAVVSTDDAIYALAGTGAGGAPV